MIKSLQKNKVLISFLSAFLFSYILLFEFIIPVNKIIPKPSILIESIPALFRDYQFLSAFLFTFSLIYIIIIVSYFLIKITKRLFFFIHSNFPKINELFVIGKYFIPFFLVLLFELWFGNSLLGEVIFILLLVMGNLKSTFFDEIENINSEYLNSAKSLGLSDKDLISSVAWKAIQPKIFDSISKNHLAIWAWTLIYEFICKTDGIGQILYLALKFNDISLLIVIFIFMVVIWLIMEIVLQNIKKKFFFWE